MSANFFGMQGVPLPPPDPGNPLGPALAAAGEKEKRMALAARLMAGAAPVQARGQTVMQLGPVAPLAPWQAPRPPQFDFEGWGGLRPRNGAKVSFAVENGDPNKPPPVPAPGFIDRAWDTLFGAWTGGGAKGPG